MQLVCVSEPLALECKVEFIVSPLPPTLPQALMHHASRIRIHLFDVLSLPAQSLNCGDTHPPLRKNFLTSLGCASMTIALNS